MTQKQKHIPAKGMTLLFVGLLAILSVMPVAAYAQALPPLESADGDVDADPDPTLPTLEGFINNAIPQTETVDGNNGGPPADGNTGGVPVDGNAETGILPPTGQMQAPRSRNVTSQTQSITATPVNPNTPPGMMLPVQGGLEEPELSPEELEAELREEAFDASVTGLLPMTPEEIKRFLRTYDDTQEAVQTPVYEYPEPVTGVETLSLEPGAPPQEIATAVGFISTVTFVDLGGDPWPIRDIGWAGDFEILQPEEEGNIIRITPLSEFAHGNISIRLVDLRAPIVLTLKTVRDRVQYRLDLRVPEYGPNGAPSVIDVSNSLKAGKEDLTSVLQGVPPEEAERLVVTGVDGRSSAYRLNGLTYFRTPLTLLSPASSSSVRSADGMTVYELEDAPVLLLSDKGKMVRAYVKEKEVDLNEF